MIYIKRSIYTNSNGTCVDTKSHMRKEPIRKNTAADYAEFFSSKPNQSVK